VPFDEALHLVAQFLNEASARVARRRRVFSHSPSVPKMF
jgi:hypothetical protein